MTIELLEKYRPWLEDSISPVVRAWSPTVASARYQRAVEQFVQRTADDEASQRYARACPVPGVDHTLYRLREVTIPNGVALLAGVHFRGQSTEYPFVGVFAQNRWLAEEELRVAHATLMTEFRVFAPQASWWWSPADRALPDLPSSTVDQYLVMGSLDEIAQTSASPLPRGWQLRRIDAASEITRAFERLYRAFHDARPDLEQAVPATTPQALEDCARAAGLYACFLQTELVGLVAAKPDDRYSVNAWLIWDIVLARRYCGQGLASVLQRAVLDRLDRSRAPLVVGTIDAQNLPSLHTALRVGRQIVGAWTFVGRPIRPST